MKIKFYLNFHASFGIGTLRLSKDKNAKIKSNILMIAPIMTQQRSNMSTSCIYNKTKVVISKIWMFYFIFATNDLSDSHFHKKFIVGLLIGREHKKEIQNKTKTYKTKEIANLQFLR